MEKSDGTLIVAWCDEDGMEFEKIHDPVKARKKLRDLFEEQAGEDFSDDHLSYYVEEWEPELKDPYSEEDEYGLRMRAIYRVERAREKTVKVFVDLDGVLARWNAEASVEDTYAPGFFLTREPEPEAIAAVRLMREKGLDVYILSCAYQNGLAEPEKDAWLAMVGLSDIPRIFVPYGKRKSDYAGGADVSVLLDDYSRNLHEWKAEGNIGCKFYNGINGTHGTWDGYSVSCGMTAEQIAAVITAIVRKQAGLQASA